MATDQSYDYIIPEKFKTIVTPGVRVVIPFGPRKITGFVIDIIEQSTVKRLREIIDVVDLTPVLTDELITLGKWLVNETLCFHISAYQAMLPQLLKMTYEKELVRVDETIPLPDELAALFTKKRSKSFQEIIENNISYYQIQQAIRQNAVKINYIVQSRETKKFTTYIKPLFSRKDFANIIADLPKQAKRQRDIVYFLRDYPEGIEQSHLIEKLKVSYQSIRALIDRQLIKTVKKEVYRSPYDIRDFKRSSPLRLTGEQQTAIRPIQQSIATNN